MSTWKIPVEWVSYATVEIEADNVEEALTKFSKVEEDLPLPTEWYYVDDSFHITDFGDEDELKATIILMNK